MYQREKIGKKINCGSVFKLPLILWGRGGAIYLSSQKEPAYKERNKSQL